MDNDYLDSVKQTKKTHQFKSLNFYLKKKEKMALYRKNLIKKLVETGYYNELFYRFKRVNTDEDIGNEMNYNDCQILQMFNNITPQEMNELYEELFFCDKLKIKEIPLNL